MYIDDFIWLPDIIEKLESKHRVLPEEVEEVFFNRPTSVLWRKDTPQERMYMSR